MLTVTVNVMPVAVDHMTRRIVAMSHILMDVIVISMSVKMLAERRRTGVASTRKADERCEN
ncbi:MAG: hypothetical protein U0892_04205 [Pirellulales bacterium]